MTLFVGFQSLVNALATRLMSVSLRILFRLCIMLLRRGKYQPNCGDGSLDVAIKARQAACVEAGMNFQTVGTSPYMTGAQSVA